jgi:hypothetical protein
MLSLLYCFTALLLYCFTDVLLTGAAERGADAQDVDAMHDADVC